MKKLILLISLLAGMSSCYNEDALVIPDQPDKYNILKDNPSDPTLHFIYQFYQKYQTVVIVNPTIADYKFNFTSDNGINITAPDQDKAVIDEGIQFLQRVLLDLYTEDFLKKNLPFSILLAKQVQMASFGEKTILNCYASGSFVALGNVTSTLKNMPRDEFIKVRADVNATFWATYMSAVRGLFTISEAFYAASEEVEPTLYSPNFFYMGNKAPSTIDFYRYGLISYDPDRSFVEDGLYSIYAPSKETDLAQWMNFVFAKTPAEIETICTSYPVMRKKYEVIRKAMFDNGFDLSKLEL